MTNQDMSTPVITVDFYPLQDDTRLAVRPLSIAKRRRAVSILDVVVGGVPDRDEDGEPLVLKKGDKVLDSKGKPTKHKGEFVLYEEDEKVTRQATEKEVMNAYLQVVELVLSTPANKENCAHLLDPEKVLDEDEEETTVGRQELEECLDEPTMFAIIKKATNIDFLAMMEKAQQMMLAETEATVGQL